MIFPSLAKFMIVIRFPVKGWQNFSTASTAIRGNRKTCECP
jgi:hypothetical protein